MKITQQILISMLPLLIIFIIGIFHITFNTDIIQIKTITKNAKIIDANRDHNQAIDVVELAKKNNIKIPKIIINFDTHSDVYINHYIMPQYGAQIADWINVLFIEFPEIEELYWVMPIEEISTISQKGTFVVKDLKDAASPLFGNTQKEPKYVNPNIDQIPYIQYFKIDKNTGRMTEFISKNAKEEFDKYNNFSKRYKKLKIITCTESSLPDFKNKNVILSIDGDYISNSGFDTGKDFKNNKNPQEINKSLKKMLNTIKKCNINPEIITLTLSPYYVPDEDLNQILNFFKHFIHISGKKDPIQEYKRGFDLPTLDDNDPYKYIVF